MWTGPVFPALPGLTYPVKRAVKWSAVKQDALSGKRTRTSLYSYPIYQYDLPFSLLRSTAASPEWQQLSGFINALAGTVGLFGFTDPNDNAASAQVFAEGDGATLGPFQLVRALGNFVEPVFLINGTPSISVNGTPTSAWTIDAYGRVTFNAGNAPGAGQPVAWTGSYYMGCRFDDDVTDLSQFMTNLWELKSLKFSTEKLP